MSTFVVHHTDLLLQGALSLPRDSASSSPSPGSPATPSSRSQKLHSLLIAFKPPISSSLIRETLLVLQHEEDGFNTRLRMGKTDSLQRAAIGAVVASIYGEALDMFLQQATEADAEANWWADLERSWQKLAWYLIQTFPLRLKRVFETVVTTLRARDLAVTPLAFTPKSLRALFPTTSRPSRLATSLFPHLAQQSRMIFNSPFELARQECRSRRHSLQEIRNNCAERLGELAMCKDQLQAIFSSQEQARDIEGLAEFVDIFQRVIRDSNSSNTYGNEQAVVARLWEINSNTLPEASASYDISISALRKPSRLTRMWPRLFLVPPVTFFLFRLIYGSRVTINETLDRAAETISGFWRGYLVQPFRDILDTVRTGGEEGARIINQKAVNADMESLERMAISLSKEKYTLSPTELEALAKQIRQGDLTPVLKVYEEDLRSPLRSALAGSLIRSLLIQVQKMKVDVDVALSGIDKLLKSQELTFAFVGVAPALAIVYAVAGWARSIWYSGQGKGRYGGKGRREAVWLSMRRIERLLILSASHPPPQSAQSHPLSPLDQGLILLSVAQLRTYAELYLPRSRLREEFLIDVSDLENPKLGRAEKKDVVKRMWRSWAGSLGWSACGKK